MKTRVGFSAFERSLRIRTSDPSFDARLREAIDGCAEAEPTLWSGLTELFSGRDHELRDRLDTELAAWSGAVDPMALAGHYGRWTGNARWAARTAENCLDRLADGIAIEKGRREEFARALLRLAQAAEMASGPDLTLRIRSAANRFDSPSSTVDSAGRPRSRTLEAARSGQPIRWLDPEEVPPDTRLPLFVLGVLGADADAAFGRLTLAPILPPEWTELTVTELPVGDSGVAFHYQSDGPTHTFRLEQPRGRTPINLVFSPALRLGRRFEVRLGTESVEADRFERGELRGFRLQTPLDSPRTITVETLGP